MGPMTDTTTNTDAAELQAQLEAPDRIEPGTAGWWRVWGARSSVIRSGDVIVTLEDGELVFDDVAAVEHLPLRFRITRHDGTTFTLGQLFAGWQLYRRGDRNTLA